MKIEILNNMRDCIRNVFLSGFKLEKIHSNEEETTRLIKMTKNDFFRGYRHAIIIDLLRLNCPIQEIHEALIDWNKVSSSPLSPNEEKNQLINYADWCFKKNKGKNGCGFKISCHRLKDFGICIGETQCSYYQKTMFTKKEEIGALSFTWEELEKYLTKTYKQQARYLVLIARAIRAFQVEKTTGALILIPLRTISSRIREICSHSFHPQEISRMVNILLDEKVIEKPVKGKQGQFFGQSNGYRFLAWRPEELLPPNKYPLPVSDPIKNTQGKPP